MKYTILVWLGLVVAVTFRAEAMGERQSAASAERVLVVGASGRTGRHVLQTLRREDKAIVPLTSNRASAVERVGNAFNWAEADVKDPKTLRLAMEGVTHIISTLGTNQVHGPNSPEFIDYGGVKNIIDVALELGTVQHVVLMSSVGATQPDHPLNQFGNVLIWKKKGEDYLRSSGIPYTIVRAGGLTDEGKEGAGLYLEQGDRRGPGEVSTARREVAELMVGLLGQPDALGKTFEAFNVEGTSPDHWLAVLSALKTD